MESFVWSLFTSILSRLLFWIGNSLVFDVVLLFEDLYAVVPWFKIDDVYIGMTAEKTGVKPKYIGKFHKAKPLINIY